MERVLVLVLVVVLILELRKVEERRTKWERGMIPEGGTGRKEQ